MWSNKDSDVFRAMTASAPNICRSHMLMVTFKVSDVFHDFKRNFSPFQTQFLVWQFNITVALWNDSFGDHPYMLFSHNSV